MLLKLYRKFNPSLLLLRRVLPIFVCICVLIITLILWQALATQENAQIDQKLELQAANIKTEITQQMQERIFALVRMAKRWENTGKPSKESWEADAQLYLQHFSGYQAIEWVDPSFHVRWIVPLAGNEQAQNFNLALEERRREALELARTHRKLTISSSINLVQGGKGFIVYIPIFQKEKCEGFILGIFRYQELFDNILPKNVIQAYDLEIFEAQKEIYRSVNFSSKYKEIGSKKTAINLNDTITWRVKVWRNPKAFSADQSLLNEMVLSTGIVMAVLLGLATNLAQTARRRTKQVETINQGLAKEINERLLAEEALRESEERYRAVVEQSAEGIFLVDVISRQIIEANSVYLNLLGYTSEEILKLTIYDIVPIERSILDKRVERALTEKHLYIRESQHLRQDGYLVYVSTSVSLISFRGRKVFCMVVHDLSEHKLAQEALQNSEARLRLALDAAHMGTWDWNIATNDVVCSDQLGPVFGLPKGSYHPTYEVFLNSVHPDDREYVEKSVNQAVKEKSNYAIEFRVTWPDQTIHWISHKGQVYCGDQNGSFMRMVGVAMDITKRKEVEEQLRWKEALLSSMNSASPLAFYVVDNCSDAILYFNHRFCEIWCIEHLEERMQRRELKNTDIMNYCLPMLRVAPKFAASCKPLQNHENQAVVEDEISFVDGRTIRRFSTQISNHLNFYFGRLYIFEEITQRKQTEQALQEANQKLRGWVKELEQSTHEITLLNEMSDLLQACLSVEEAHKAIATLVQPMFPNISGGVFTISSSRQIVEAVATWGNQLASQKMFAPHDCWALRRGRSHWVTETKIGLRCQHLHPETACVESLCVPMMAQGEALGLLYLSSNDLGLLSDAKQRLAVTVAEHIALALANLTLRETLQKQSIRDPLTGLFNRRYLEESLLREIHRAERKQQSVGIIMLDIDHFKRFNDTFGHEAGDTVLRELGLFLRKNIRQSDIACRYGGEELTLILPESNLESTQQRAEQIREGVKLLQVLHRRQLLGSITISLGVACFPEHGLTGDAVIRSADEALYQAKAKGRDRVAAR